MKTIRELRKEAIEYQELAAMEYKSVARYTDGYCAPNKQYWASEQEYIVDLYWYGRSVLFELLGADQESLPTEHLNGVEQVLKELINKIG